MELSEVLVRIVGPALACLPISMDTPKARLLMLSIGLQESAFSTRVQVINGGGKGPARSFWQMERGGGVDGVMRHPSSTGFAHRFCAERDIPFNAQSIWGRMETDDILGAVFARLLLYTDAKRLPEPDDVEGAWLYYSRNWRPGKPHPDKWPQNHARACAALGLA